MRIIERTGGFFLSDLYSLTGSAIRSNQSRAHRIQIIVSMKDGARDLYIVYIMRFNPDRVLKNF